MSAIASPTMNSQALLDHLEMIENEKVKVIEKFFSGETEEKREFEAYINHYIFEVQQRIKDFENDSNKYHHPFVIIGSIVEVEDLEDGEVMRLDIISPFFKDTDYTLDCASYLSPIGRGLLLKGLGDIARIDTPTGSIEYKIKLIENPI
ncbi:MAG: GreA/GreB family elongation factor [Peptostreptococcales bacterium]|jgi:transcription elongation factor GreA